ncbi:hypothetical protein ACWEN3_45525 [Streptomyces sp. NPDC004561]
MDQVAVALVARWLAHTLSRLDIRPAGGLRVYLSRAVMSTSAHES